MSAPVPRHVLLFIFQAKGSSTLDYALPLLWKMRRDLPRTRISVFYAVLSRRSILRRSGFYSRVLSRNRIRQYDHADFLPFPDNVLRGVWRRLYGRSPRDTPKWTWRSSRLPFVTALAKRMRRWHSRLGVLLRTRVRYERIMRCLHPDLVLLENRGSNFLGREEFFDFLARTKTKTVLLPHAPHHVWEARMVPFRRDGEALPDYCRYWMPFRFEKTWSAMPHKKAQFAYVGYPGMDSDWLNSIRRAQGRRVGGSLRCLFIIRNFLREREVRTEDTSPFRPDYEEFMYYANLIGSSLRESNEDVEVIVKPHPATDFTALGKALRSSDIERWVISQDAIYSLLPEIDFAVTMYSTVNFVVSMYGIPVLVLHTHAHLIAYCWQKMEDLYTGFRFYTDPAEGMRRNLSEIIDIAKECRRSGRPWLGDVEHLREFYPDGATERAMSDLGLVV